MLYVPETEEDRSVRTPKSPTPSPKRPKIPIPVKNKAEKYLGTAVTAQVA